MKGATQGSYAWWQQCGVCACVCVGEIKDMTWGNNAKFHLFVFSSKVVLMGPSTFKNRPFFNGEEGRGESEEERKRAETGGVLCGRRMQFEIGQIAPPPPAAHEA